MSGHSKWSTIKRKKGTNDARRGKLFTKLIKEILVSSRIGGDENANPRLRTAVQNAKVANMPQATIDRAIRRGTRKEDGVDYEEGLFEGYGPGGAAIMIETLTDNRNRTVAELRHVFNKYSGNLAENGSVAWMFDQKGLVEVEKSAISEEDLLMVVMDSGAEDIQDADEVYEISVAIPDFESVKQALEVGRINYVQATLSWIPKNMLQIQSKEAEQAIQMLETLEDLDDVQKVFSNFYVQEDELQKLIG